MRKRLGIYGASDETVALIPLLEANPQVEIAVVFDPDPAAARARLAGVDVPEMGGRLTDDLQKLAAAPGLHAVIDAGLDPDFATAAPETAAGGVQIVSPLTARLLWGYGVAARDHKAELLQALHEVVESYNLTVDRDELFSRMLEIAVGVTGADGGSLMLLDEERALTVRVAIGIEPELWPKIRVPLGEGIAGRAAREARAIRIRGRADRAAFRIVRERLDVESALCVPLVHEGVVLGVLNLHHATRPDVFDDADQDFVRQLATLDARIIARAREHATLLDQAERYAAVRDARGALEGPGPLAERLGALCTLVAERVGRGIATAYLYDPHEDELRLAATSLAGGGLGGDYRIRPGQGLDGRAAAERRPIFLSDRGGPACAALPLMAGADLVGLVSVQTGGGEEPGRWGREALLEVAAVAADAVARTRREERMATRATKLGAINEMGVRLLAATETQEVARQATASGALILSADHAILRLRDPETGRYGIRSYFGSAGGRQQEALFRLDKAVSVGVIKRRTPSLVRDVRTADLPGAQAAPVQTLMAAPLRNDGVVIGTLAFYDRTAGDDFRGATFDDDDFQIFGRFTGYVERALANASFHTRSRRHRDVDPETDLPDRGYLARRIDEEIARVAGGGGRLALAVLRIENWPALVEAGDPVHLRRVATGAAAALRAAARPFDVTARTGECEFAALLPEPGPVPAETVSALARAVADRLAGEDALAAPERPALAFGYAVYPDDGTDRDALLAAASRPRIRTV